MPNIEAELKPPELAIPAVPVELVTSAWGSRTAQRRALLVHGLGSVGADWWQVADALAHQGFRVVAPDLRGHGGSPAASSYRIADLVGDLHQLGGGWDLVIGHSFGGLLAAAAAAEQGFARSLVLLDPVLDVPDDVLERVVQGELASCRVVATVEGWLEANPGWHPQDAVAKTIFSRSANLHAVERWMRDNEPLHQIDQARRLTVRTVILGADPELGAFFTPEVGRALEAANPMIRSRTVAGSGHAVYRDDCAAVLAAAAEAAQFDTRTPT
jgi:pimeloyl-ACP methyl ester carboxylesterase